jgi:hypothetical protein
MAQGGKDNITDEYGTKNAHQKENAEKAKFRGYPKKSHDGEDGENWNADYDPNMWCRHWPDGSWERQAYGKKPSYSFRHSSGHHQEILQDGTNYSYNSGPKFSVNKSDVVETNNGSTDSLTHNGARSNAGTEKGGGSYASAGKGGMAMAGGTGGVALHSDKNLNIASAGTTKVTGSKELAMGSGDNGGQHAQTLYFKSDGTIALLQNGARSGGSGGSSVAAAGGGGGGGDIVIKAKSGSIKFAAGNGSKQSSITLGADGTVTLAAMGGDMSFASLKDMKFGPEQGYKWALKPGMPKGGLPDRKTTYHQEKGQNASEYASYHGSEGSEIT